MLQNQTQAALETLAKGPLTFTSERAAEEAVPGILAAFDLGYARDPSPAIDPGINIEISTRGMLALDGNLNPTRMQVLAKALRGWLR